MSRVPQRIETERLSIRMPDPGHAQEMRTAVEESFDRLSEWMDWAQEIPTLEETERSATLARREFLAERDLRYHIFLRGAETLVGGSGLHRIDWSVPRFEIGYWLRTGYEGKGYATEAVRAIAGTAFSALRAARVEIRCDVRNERSAAVARRAGFALEAVLKNERRTLKTREISDTLLFARISPER